MTTRVEGSSARTRLVSVDAVERRDPDVDDGDVGSLAKDRFPARQTVRSLGDDVKGALERRAQSGASQRMILDDDDANSIAGSRCSNHSFAITRSPSEASA